MLTLFLTRQMKSSGRVPISIAGAMTGIHPEIVRWLVRDGVVNGSAPYRVVAPVGEVDLAELERVATILRQARESAPDEEYSIVEGAKRYGFSNQAVYKWIENGWLHCSNGRIAASELAYARALRDLPSTKPNRRRVFPTKPV